MERLGLDFEFSVGPIGYPTPSIAKAGIYEKIAPAEMITLTGALKSTSLTSHFAFAVLADEASETKSPFAALHFYGSGEVCHGKDV